MRLSDLIPDPEVLAAFEPDELGLRMLPLLGTVEHWNLRDLIKAVLGDPRLPGNHPDVVVCYPQEHARTIELALREAWAWLTGAALLVPHPASSDSVMMLSRRAKKLAQEPDPRLAFSARRIPKDALHQSIREDVWSLYHRGRYDTAVLEAMKAVEVAVRAAAKYTNAAYGTDMIA